MKTLIDVCLKHTEDGLRNITKNKPSIVSALFAFVLLLPQLIAPQSAFAEETAAEPAALTTPKLAMAITSYVNMYDAVGYFAGDKYNAEANIFNGNGVALGVRLGIELRDANTHQVVHVKTSPDVFALDEKQTLHRSVSLPLREVHAGDYEVFLVARNTAGFTLAGHDLGKVSFVSGALSKDVSIDTSKCSLSVVGDKSTKKFGLGDYTDILPTESLSLHCAVANSGKEDVSLSANFRNYERSYYGVPLANTAIEGVMIILPAGATREFNVTLPTPTKPQLYFGALELKWRDITVSNTVYTSMRVHGAGETIRNVMPNKSVYASGETAIADVVVSPFVNAIEGSRIPGEVNANGKIKLSLTDSANEVCASGESDFTPSDMIKQVSMKATHACSGGKLTVTLMSDDGALFGAQTFAMPTSPLVEAGLSAENSTKSPKTSAEKTTTSSQLGMVLAVGIALILVIALAVYLIKRGHGGGIAILVLFVALAGAQVKHAQAYSFIFYYNCGLGPCPLATSIWVSGGVTSPTYAPGQAMNADYMWSSDDHPVCNSGCNTSLRASINGSAYSQFWSGKLYSQPLRDGYFGSGGIGSAPGSAGTYPVRFVGSVSTYVSPAVQTDSFTVSAPSCPADAPYTENNQASINNYCNATIGACAGGYHYPSSLSCDAAPGWAPYGASCTSPSCGGCSCIPDPVAGVCSGTHYGCVQGSSGGIADTASQYNWTCYGSNGGANAPCSETKCSASMGQACSSSANSCGQTNAGTISCSGACSATTPANPANYGNSCSSSANSCGQTNAGTISCSGSCSATTPANPAGYGNSCSSSANSCGQTNAGTISCSGACSATTPGNPANYGNSCSSSANSCGQTNSGTISCSGACSATTPGNPAGYGNSCSSSANACGQTNAGTISCSGACSAATPANPAGYGNSCSSSANSCGQTNAGTITCSGACSATTPGNPANYGNSCTQTNACGQSNTGTITCAGSCSVGAPALPAGYGNSCSSSANVCGMTNSGTISCSGACSAATPPNSSCSYTVSTSAGAGASFSPASASVVYTNTRAFNVTLSSGYKMTVTGCGGTSISHVKPGTYVYTTGSITSSCTVTASTAVSTGSITPAAACSIAGGQSTCPSNVSWSTTGVTSAQFSGGGVSQSTLTGAAVPTTLNYGSNPFTLIDVSNAGDGAVTLAQTTVNVSCAGGSYWSPGQGKCLLTPTASMTVTPSSIGYNESTHLVWTSSNISSCNITNNGVSISTSPNNATDIILTTTSNMVIDCVNSDGQHATNSKIVTVSGAPTGGITGAPSCNIPLGQSSCTANVTWSMTNATSPEVWVTPPGGSKTLQWITATGNQPFVYTGVGQYKWESDSNSVSLASMNVTIACASGTWDSVQSKCLFAPTVSWTWNGTPSVFAVSADYGDPNTFSFTSSNANSCIYTNDGVPVPVGLSNTWNNQAFIVPHALRVVCTNAAGSVAANLNIAINTNSSSMGVVTIPEFVMPGQAFTATVSVTNNGSKAWSGVTTPHRLCVAPSAQGSWGVACSSGNTLGVGASTNISVPLTAPNTQQDYAISFQMREEGLKDEAGSLLLGTGNQYFGPTAQPAGATGPGGTPNVPVGSIRVKAPTLVVNPNDYTFPDTVAGDPATVFGVTVWNVGGGTVTGSGISGLAAPFSCPSCSFTANAGASTVLNAQFAPAATGTFTSIGTVNATNPVQSASVTLRGRGVDMLRVTPSSGIVDFADAQGASGMYRNITIENQSVSTHANGLSVAFGTSTFSCSPACGGNIQPGQRQTIRFWFHPPIIRSGGAPVTINSNATISFNNISNTVLVGLRGRDVPVKLQYNEN